MNQEALVSVLMQRMVDFALCNYVRSIRRRKNHEIEEVNHDLCIWDVYPDKLSIEEDYEEKEMIQIVYETLAELSKADQHLLKLWLGFYGEPYYQKEIATMLSINQATVSKRLMDILNNLREKLQSKGILERMDIPKSRMQTKR